MAILLAIWAVCFLSTTISHGAWGIAEVPQVVIPKNDSRVPIPCVGLLPDQRPSLLYWFIGETWEIAKDSLVFRFSDPNVGQNLSVNVRYSLSHDFDLVIGKIDTTDSGRYWCRVAGEEYPEAVDVTVFVRDLLPGPVIWWASSERPISKVNVVKHQILNCSVNNVYPNPELTWSFIGCRTTANQSMELFTSNQQSNYDVFAKTYDVTKKAYFGALDLKANDICEFECVAKGVAIRNGSSSTAVEIFAKAQQPESKSPNIALIFAFIVLALILIICFIALMYFMFFRMRHALLPQRRVVTYEKQEERQPTGTPDEKTGLFTDSESNDMEDITVDGATQWSSRRSLEDYRDLFNEDTEPIGNIQAVIGDSRGLLLATTEAVIRYPNRHKSIKPEICTKDKFSGNVTSIVLHPQSENVIVCLNKVTPGKGNTNSILVNVNSGNCKDWGKLGKFTSPMVTVDGAGTIFVGDLDDKRIHMFEPTFISGEGKTTSVSYKLDIGLKNIAAYGWKHLFVGNGKDTINKYSFTNTRGCLTFSKNKDCIMIPAKKDKGLGEIVAHNNLLYVVNDTQIIAYDVEVFQMLHVFETGFQNLRGLCFFGMTGVALYSNERVHIYEIEKAKQKEGTSSATV